MQNILCFSHLPWNFVYQRPQHLMSRFAKVYTVYYFEEPKQGDSDGFQIIRYDDISVVEIYLGNHSENRNTRLENIVNAVIKEHKINDYNLWYYTPMALEYTAHLQAEVVIYDSMDELSAFKFAPPQLISLENDLFRKADIVFTGGHSLYNAKKHRHHNIHPFPSSIDKAHFGAARQCHQDPDDQKDIPHPRLGFFGVVDERFNTELLREVSFKRPDWHFVIIGPVVKISEDELPRAENIHYLGSKQYTDLPQYISSWDIALILFALNESTEFISPTKTPEYLTAGLPVISTAIKDVVNPYGTSGLVHIIHDSKSFIKYGEEELSKKNRSEWMNRVDEFLADDSWDNTFGKMNQLISNLKTENVYV